MRRYATLKPSKGTTIPYLLRSEVSAADLYQCAGPKAGMPGECMGSLELDHVRASHAIGLKSSTERGNLISLCGSHHRLKTENGKTWRPKLLEYIEERDR